MQLLLKCGATTPSSQNPEHENKTMWCAKCWVYARCHLRAEAAEPVRAREECTREYRNMLNIILKIQEGDVPDRNAKGWKVVGYDRCLQCENEYHQQTPATNSHQYETNGLGKEDSQSSSVERTTGYAREDTEHQHQEWISQHAFAEGGRFTKTWDWHSVNRRLSQWSARKVCGHGAWNCSVVSTKEKQSVDSTA